MSTFAPVQVGKFYAETPKDHEWVLHGYLARGGLTAIAAFPKAGKSTWAYALVEAVAHSKPFMGREVHGGAVLILAVEEHPVDIRLRLQKFGVTAEDSVYVHSSTLTPDAQTFIAINAFVAAHGIVLLVLDTIGHVWSVKDEQSNAEVHKALKPWLELVRDTNVAGLLVDHEGKVPQDGGRSLRGASSFAGIVDLILTLRTDKSPAQRRLLATGRYQETPAEITLELTDDGQYLVMGGPLPPAQAKVVAFLAHQEGYTASWTAIVNGTGLGPSTLHKTLPALSEKGMVKSPDTKEAGYTLTSTGIQASKVAKSAKSLSSEVKP
jgi:hypothetical protein